VEGREERVRVIEIEKVGVRMPVEEEGKGKIEGSLECLVVVCFVQFVAFCVCGNLIGLPAVMEDDCKSFVCFCNRFEILCFCVEASVGLYNGN
jgi:hypothetical protein